LKQGKNILICPLDWGLGHAGRMAALAKHLARSGNTLIVAASDSLKEFFSDELPGTGFVRFPGFRPRYSRHLPQYIILLVQIPLLLYHIVREHIEIRNLIRKYEADIVISDNRFGLWNRKVKTVYVTHQVRIPFPPLLRPFEFIGILFHRFIITRYTWCFIPDLPGEINLSGRLSHGLRLPANTIYTGLLSRFTDYDKTDAGDSGRTDYYLAILSGPEPQKSIFGETVIRLFSESDQNLVVLEGLPGSSMKTRTEGRITRSAHLHSSQMAEMITGAKGIITRSGYSTIMELVSLGSGALLVPTPGQTEQEYLAEYLSEKGWFGSISQQALQRSNEFSSGFRGVPEEIVSESELLLERATAVLLKDQQDKDHTGHSGKKSRPDFGRTMSSKLKAG